MIGGAGRRHLRPRDGASVEVKEDGALPPFVWVALAVHLGLGALFLLAAQVLPLGMRVKRGKTQTDTDASSGMSTEAT